MQSNNFKDGHEEEEEHKGNDSKQGQQQPDKNNLELENLSREELIQLVQQLMFRENEAHQKQMEEANKEAEESANSIQQQEEKQQEMATKLEEQYRALLAIQQKVEGLTAEIAKLSVKCQKQFEEFSKRIVQLQQEKEVESHKVQELDKKFEESTEKQIVTIQRQMKIQMAKETWFDMLALVPRRQLGQIVPLIGDRQFAAIIQPFLHNYREITLGNIAIFPPNDGNKHPVLQVWPKYAGWYKEPWNTLSQQMILPDIGMTENIKDFLLIRLCFLDMSVVNFLRKFQQNSLLWNVNLDLSGAHSHITKKSPDVTTLSHVLPLINNINSIRGRNILQLGYIYDANGVAVDMLKMARIYEANRFFTYHFAHREIELINRWLFTPREDGRPRVLIFTADVMFTDFCKVSLLIDDCINRFSTAQSPCSFFIRLLVWVHDTDEWHDICMENGQTKEKLVIKKVASHKKPLSYQLEQKMMLILRYPLGAGKQWIEANEREVLNWDFFEQDRRIDLHYARFEHYGCL